MPSAIIIAGMRAGLDAGRSLAPEAAVEAGLEEVELNPGQRDAARAILLSPHRTVGVQGHAGSGKTTMLRAVKRVGGRESDHRPGSVGERRACAGGRSRHPGPARYRGS